MLKEHRRNPSRSRHAPKRYTDTECVMKGSGKAGEVNGVDFDQYDRRFDGHKKASWSERRNVYAEARENTAHEELVKKLHTMDKINGHLPDLIKDKVKEATFGRSEALKDAEFIAPEGEVETMRCRLSDKSEEEFSSGDETSEDDCEFCLGCESGADSGHDYGEYCNFKGQKPGSNIKYTQEQLDIMNAEAEEDNKPSRPCDVLFQRTGKDCHTCKKTVDKSIMTALEKKEHGISGMCAPCQRRFFASPPKEEEEEWDHLALLRGIHNIQERGGTARDEERFLDSVGFPFRKYQ